MALRTVAELHRHSRRLRGLGDVADDSDEDTSADDDTGSDDDTSSDDSGGGGTDYGADDDTGSDDGDNSYTADGTDAANDASSLLSDLTGGLLGSNSGASVPTHSYTSNGAQGAANSNAGGQPLTAPPATAPSASPWPWIIGLAVVGVAAVVIVKKKRKKNPGRRRSRR